MYVCAQGVIQLMYWYLYFNLFQDLILQLWPWNQYLHLWSTTFNQFCPRLISTMDCLILDTCLLSSIDPFCWLSSVAVRWEVTSHLNPRPAASHHPPASPDSLLSCPASLCPPAFTTLFESWLSVLQLWFMTNKSTPPTAKWETGMQNKGKWPLARHELLFFSWCVLHLGISAMLINGNA